ncbi:MAG: HlyD family secretion protein [Pseudorhodoplanes sp.]
MTRGFAVAAMAAMLALAACGKESEPRYQGWIEADLVFVGPDENGRVEQLAVREGDRVETGAPLFVLDSDLQKADVMQNEATVTNAQQALDRARALLSTSAGTQRTVDDAEAALRTAQARLNSAQTRLARRRITSSVAGYVQQIYFRPGEVVNAGKPILSLLPPGNMKVRFYVPQAMLPKIAIGQTVNVNCDGCENGLVAKVSFIAENVEFTPPVIYSLEERAKLVFLIEARPEKPDKLRVGQPVTVTTEPPK